MKRITFVLLMLVATVLAACSGNDTGASASGSTAASASGSTEASASSEASEPAETDEPISEPSTQPGAGDLAAFLPTEVGGLEIEYESTSGEDMVGEEATPEALALFERLGVDASNLSQAVGIGFDAEAGSAVTVLAIRVEGADEGELRDEFRAAIEAEDPEMTFNDANVGGKDVQTFGPEGGDAVGYVYVKGDIVFVVGGQPVSLAEEALEKLP